jgi:hypothetical protein
MKMRFDKFPATALINFVKSIHLYSRSKIAKESGSRYSYGDGEFGDTKILQKAKEDYLEKQKSYNESLAETVSMNQEEVVRDGTTPAVKENLYGDLYLFPIVSDDKRDDAVESESDMLSIQIEASQRSMIDFMGKDYLFDISPQSVFIIRLAPQY